MNHISLETAKKLVSLGWTRETEFNFYDVYNGNIDQYQPEVWHNNWAEEVCLNRICAAPLATELLEVLPKRILDMPVKGNVLTLVIEWFWDTKTLHFFYRDECTKLPYEMFDLREEEVLAEALALLLIKLVEQGVVSRESLSNNA